MALPLSAAEFQRVGAVYEFSSSRATVSGLSADGSTIVGTQFDFPQPSRAYTCKEGVLTLLPTPPSATDTTALAISTNGSVVVGQTRVSQNWRAIRWLNGIPTVFSVPLPAPSSTASAEAVTPDGTLVAGRINATGGSTPQVWFWSAGSGVQVLGTPSPLAVHPSAILHSFEPPKLSATGNVIAAEATFRIPLSDTNSKLVTRIVRWVNNGAPEFLEQVPDFESSVLVGISNDGSQIVGTLRAGPLGERPCRWTALVPEILSDQYTTVFDLSADASVILLGRTYGRIALWTPLGVTSLPFNTDIATAKLSNDGQVVVAQITSSFHFQSDAYSLLVWDQFNGVRPVAREVLREFRSSEMARHRQFVLQDVANANGRITITGTSTLPFRSDAFPTSSNQYYEQPSDGWAVTLDSPSQPNPFAGTLLDRTDTFVPRFQLTESLGHKFVSYIVDDPGEPPLKSVDPATVFKSRLRIFVSARDINQETIDANTPIQLVLGGFAFAAKLGDDPEFAPGKRSVAFKVFTSPGSLGFPQPIGTVKCSWSSSALTIAVDLAQTENVTSAVPTLFNPFATPTFGVGLVLGDRDLLKPVLRFLPLDVRFGDQTGSRMVRLETKADVRETKDYLLLVASAAGSFDEIRPKISLLLPAPNAKVLLPQAPVVAIDVKENSLVDQLLFRVNGGEWLSNLIDTIVPIPGENLLEAKAIDVFGNESTVVARKFIYFTKTGIYTSLLLDGDSLPRGKIDFSLTELGSFSGSAILEGRKFAVRGAFDELGEASVSLRLGGNTATLKLKLEVDGAGNLLTGTLEHAGATFILNAARFLYDGRNTQAPSFEVFSLLFEPSGEPATPSLFGYAQLVSGGWQDGSLLLKGLLADGTPLNHRVRVDGHGTIPVYLPLYGKGFLAGQLSPQDVPGVSDFGGRFTWKRPPSKAAIFPQGFDTALTVIGSKNYPSAPTDFPPLNLQDSEDRNATLMFSGGGLSSPLHRDVRAAVYSSNSSDNLFLSLNGFEVPFSKKSFSVNGSFPGFTGQFQDPASGDVIKFGGVFFRKQNLITGLFVGPGGVGTVTLEPHAQ